MDSLYHLLAASFGEIALFSFASLMLAMWFSYLCRWVGNANIEIEFFLSWAAVKLRDAFTTMFIISVVLLCLSLSGMIF